MSSFNRSGLERVVNLNRHKDVLDEESQELVFANLNRKSNPEFFRIVDQVLELLNSSESEDIVAKKIGAIVNSINLRLNEINNDSDWKAYLGLISQTDSLGNLKGLTDNLLRSLISERTYLLRFLANFQSSRHEIETSLDVLKTVFYDAVNTRFPEGIGENNPVGSVSKKLAELFLDINNLDKDAQLNRLREIVVFINEQLAEIHSKKSAIQREIEIAQIQGLNDDIKEKQSTLNTLRKTYQILSKFLFYVALEDMDAIKRMVEEEVILHEEVSEEESKKEETALQNEVIRGNLGLRFLANEGFDPTILSLDVMSLPEEERKQGIERKYRYIESAFFSLCLSAFLSEMNPRTWQSTDLSALQFQPPSIPGGQLEKTFTAESLAIEISNGATPIEKGAAEAVAKKIKFGLFYLTQWHQQYIKHFNANTMETYIEAVPDDTTTQFFDKQRIEYLFGLPPIMHKLENGDWVEDDSGYSLMGQIIRSWQAFFKSTRYVPGYSPNLILMDLNKIIPKRASVETAPRMWLLPDENGDLVRYITVVFPYAVSEQNEAPVGGTIKNSPLLPAPITAKGGPNVSRMQLISEQYQGLLRDRNMVLADDSPIRAIFPIAGSVLETSGYSASCDRQLPIMKNGQFLIDDFGETTYPMTIEGKHISTKLGNLPEIAVKYSTPDAHREITSQFGVVNRSAIIFSDPVPNFFEFAVIRARVPETGEIFLGTLRDWIQLYGDDENLMKYVFSQLSGSATYDWAQCRNHAIYFVNYVNKTGAHEPITQVLKLNILESLLEVANSDLLNSLVNLRRVIGYYTVGTYNNADLRTFGYSQSEIHEEHPDLVIQATDDQAEITRKEKKTKQLLELRKKKERATCDQFLKVLVRNNVTGEIQEHDTTLHHQLQIRPAILLNQFDDSQITGVKNGTHYAKWTKWEEMLPLIMADPTRSSEEKEMWREFAENSEDYPMDLLIINVDPLRREIEDEHGMITVQNSISSPQFVLEQAAFFEILGAAQSAGNIMQRMSRAERAAFEILFSEESRELFVYGYHKGSGQVSARKLAIKMAELIGGRRLKKAVGGRIKNEFPADMALPPMATRSAFLRLLHGRLGVQSTLMEVLGDEKERDNLLGILSPLLS